MTRMDVLKLKAVVLYIINKRGEIDFMHLFKILYFAERSQYAEYGQHLIKDSFCALQNGPVPSFLYDAVKHVTNRPSCQHDYLDIITSAIEPVGGECDYVLKAKEAPDMTFLSEAEIEAIDLAYSQNIDKNFDDLSNSSHDEAWHEAWGAAENSPMCSLSIAKAGGASSGFLKYIAENEELEQIIAG